ncbi:MAG: thermonuclease family protein [Desertifilum sp.]|nr:thermonuclease family protein [Desertifilum sp.]
MKDLIPFSIVALLGFGVVAIAANRPGASPSTSTIAPLPNTHHGWRVTAGSVHDGDTLRVTRGNEELKIRLCGIDAPELAQPLGKESRDFLRSLLPDNREVMLIPIETDRYGRTVAEIFVDNGNGTERHVNSELTVKGLAYHYQQYSGKCPNKFAIASGEEMAIANQRGIWEMGKNYEKPWDYRRKTRNR